MNRDDKIALGIIIGGGLIAMSKSGNAAVASAVEWGDGWHMPVLDWQAPDGRMYPAVVSQEMHPGHAGVDIMYQRTRVGDRPEFAPGPAGHATTMFFAPPGTPIVAARDARIWSIDKAATGYQVVLDHGKPWATYYAHLETIDFSEHVSGYVKGTKNVTNIVAGQRLGTMGWNPNTVASKGAVDAQLIRHLHFECWYKGGGSQFAQNPQAVMAGWERASW